VIRSRKRKVDKQPRLLKSGGFTEFTPIKSGTDLSGLRLGQEKGRFVSIEKNIFY
jgi:hypothetical protein